MKVPTLYTGACLLFWGVESGHLFLSLPIAVLLESANFTSQKWHLQEDDFVRISDFTSVIFLASVALILLNYETIFFLKTVMHWQPLVVLPLILAQLYSTNDKIIIGTKIGRKKKRAHVHQPMDFSVMYCGICLFSAAVINSRSDLFFPTAVILISWILFFNRGKAFSIPIFLLVVFLAAGLGFLGYQGSEKAHDYLSLKVGSMMRGYYWSKFADPFQTYLTFGTLKKDKLSGQILLRLKSHDNQPLLLRQASYATYIQNRWKSDKSFSYLPVSEQGWQLLPEPEKEGHKANIELYLPKEQGLLPSPNGSYRVSGDHLFELGMNSAGIVKIIDAASLVTYDIWYNDALKGELDTPTNRNLQIPPEEEYVIEQIAAELHLETLSPKEQVATLHSFFSTKFAYSLTINSHYNSPTYLGDFLLSHRKGYCEMFATASTLLLRKAGTPSRYVTGFAAMEYSSRENRFIVRKRHAHAWTEAFIDGKWLSVDTTPSGWPEYDGEKRSFFEPAQDLFSFLKLYFDRFRIQTEQRYRLFLSTIIILLTSFLGFRIYRRMQAKTSKKTEGQPLRSFYRETPFTRIEKKLQETAIPRGKGEPFLEWANRLNEQIELDMKKTEHLYNLHQKLRFDPRGLSPKDYNELQKGVAQWLNSFQILTTEQLQTKE